MRAFANGMRNGSRVTPSTETNTVPENANFNGFVVNRIRAADPPRWSGFKTRFVRHCAMGTWLALMHVNAACAAMIGMTLCGESRPITTTIPSRWTFNGSAPSVTQSDMLSWDELTRCRDERAHDQSRLRRPRIQRWIREHNGQGCGGTGQRSQGWAPTEMPSMHRRIRNSQGGQNQAADTHALHLLQRNRERAETMNHHDHANLRPMADTERVAKPCCETCGGSPVLKLDGHWLCVSCGCARLELDGCFHCGFTPCKCPQWRRDEVYGTKPTDRHGNLMTHLAIIAAGLLIAAGVVTFYLATNH